MRKVETIVMPPDSGRDAGKIFILTEMPATVAEKWATRALLALAKSGVDIGEAAGAGVAGIAAMGFKALSGLSWADAEPLFDQMMTCVTIQPDPKRKELTRPLIGDDDIEEIATLLRLRMEVFRLCSGFSLAGPLSTSLKTGAPAVEKSETTSTSHLGSARSSRRSKQPSTS